MYEAFAAPGRMHVQIAEMPAGQRYLWTARAVTRRRGGWGEPGKTFAIGLGYEIRHTHRRRARRAAAGTSRAGRRSRWPVLR
ncbi:hypothetical protein GCM10010448_47020 [Streptomyces glomeratus]|uniref:Short-chain fatty acyl coenzyme A regulators C-terminal domain-containing protein n=1 Tax=Streptomyces glomeratus TaxID=284452 RepID=A0ABP6LSA7_9ACTN